MKIKINKKSRSLIKLHILKYQIYKNYNKYFFNENIENLTIEIKQALKIIYLYHVKNKKILFIGLPYNKQLSNQLNHFFISKKIYLKKMMSNSTYLFKTIHLPKTPDLIVFNNTSDKDLTILNTLKKSNIPVVLFKNLNKFSNDFYNVNGSLKNKKIKKFYFFLIFSVLTKYIKTTLLL